MMHPVLAVVCLVAAAAFLAWLWRPREDEWTRSVREHDELVRCTGPRSLP